MEVIMRMYLARLASTEPTNAPDIDPTTDGQRRAHATLSVPEPLSSRVLSVNCGSRPGYRGTLYVRHYSQDGLGRQRGRASCQSAFGQGH